ncbi:hypothetical protein [Virgibacillus sp. DJP39]|uniref:hypothetical protein n=1 Tax=Virgibacillus sp. DJP39 TaxID=3409790 RepID=UPI003BB7BA1C
MKIDYDHDADELKIKWNEKLTFFLKHDHYSLDDVWKDPKHTIVIRDNGFSFFPVNKDLNEENNIEDVFFGNGGKVILEYDKEFDGFKCKILFFKSERKVIQEICNDIRYIESEVKMNVKRKSK